jgi:hypothetical protein
MPVGIFSQYGLQRLDEMIWDEGLIKKNKHDYFDTRRKQYMAVSSSLVISIFSYILLFLFACWSAEF